MTGSVGKILSEHLTCKKHGEESDKESSDKGGGHDTVLSK